MSNKLVFRILGALASSLIVVSVFLPYVSVAGYSESLWKTYKAIDSLYLPIMIIVFGVIGIIFFSLNIKTEFAYASAGAVLFFAVMQTFDVVNQGIFNTLSVGYYCLALGSILTGVMAFLCNLRSNKAKTKSETVDAENNTIQNPTLAQINDLYEQNPQQEIISPIQPINDVIEPIQLNPIPEQLTTSIPEANSIQNQPLSTISEPVQNQSLQAIPEINPIPQQPAHSVQEPSALQNNSVAPMQVTQPQQNIPNVSVQQPVNPVVEQFTENAVNPVVQEFVVNNPQVQNGGNNINNAQPVLEQNQNTIPPINAPASVNPVVQEFVVSNPQVQNGGNNINNAQPVLEQNQNTVPLNSINEPANANPVVQEFTSQEQGLQFNQNSNNNETDIFGQPINK